MKKIMYFIVSILTYYIAGLYHSLPLLLLYFAEMFLFFLMYVQAQYLKKKVSFSFAAEQWSIWKGRDTCCNIYVYNQSRIPVSRFQVKMEMIYGGTKKGEYISLYGNSDSQMKSQVEFYIRADYCGLLYFSIENSHVYDYLSLFHPRKRQQSMVELVIFPEEKYIPISFLSGAMDSTYHEIPQIEHQGKQNNTIRQIREYRSGDLSRQIHWNLSARSEKVWIKEMDREREEAPEIYLDVVVGKGQETGAMDAFYEIVSALLLGILHVKPGVRVWWLENFYKDIQEPENSRELLYYLYQLQEETIQEIDHDILLGKRMQWQGIWLDRDLSLYYQGEKKVQFSRENYMEELKKPILL